MATRTMKRESGRKNQAGEIKGGAIVSGTKSGTASLTSTGSSLELMSNAMKATAMRAGRDRRSGVKSPRHLRPAGLLSSATESRRDGAKAVAVKVEVAKAGADHFGCTAARIRSRQSSVMPAGAAVEARSIPRSHEARPVWGGCS